MVGLRNPFAVRNGNIILIEDLNINDRGLQCQCKCPVCDGDFIARMGDVKIHHFAHSKEACDEVLAYTSGLYRLIQQILNSDCSFYIPALAVTFDLKKSGILNKNNINLHIEIIDEHHWGKYKVVVSPGRYIKFDNAELCVDNKNHIQALELTYKGNKMAIKVMPPDTVCKMAMVSPHNGMATLVIDFVGDADKIQTSNSTAFQEYLLSENLLKFWIHNPKVKKAYPELLVLAKKAHEEYIERQKRLEEEKEAAIQRWVEQRQLEEKLIIEKRVAEIAADMEKQKEQLNLGYEQVKDKFVQQTTQIRDDFGFRWIKCKECGKIKREFEFTSYGGINQVNLGRCSLCSRKRDRSNQSRY